MAHTSDLSATLVHGLTFCVGQDRAGRWLAMEATGQGGGMFASREAAMRYALAEVMHQPGSVMLSTEPVGFV